MLEPQTNKEEEFSYVSKPSNPNILFAVPRPKVTTVTTTTTPVVRGEVLEDDDEEGGGGEEVVQKKVKIVEEYPPERPPERKTEDAYVRELENFIAPLLREALAPVYDTLGMIEQDSGKRQFYRFAGKDLSREQRMTPIEWGCATVEEFFKKNKHLGDVIIGNLKQYIIDNKRKIEREEQRRAQEKKAKQDTDKMVKQYEDIIKKMDSKNNELMKQFKQYVEQLEKSNIKLTKRLNQMQKLQKVFAKTQKEDMSKIKIALGKLYDEITLQKSEDEASEEVVADAYKKGAEDFKRTKDDESIDAKIGTYDLIGTDLDTQKNLLTNTENQIAALRVLITTRKNVDGSDLNGDEVSDLLNQLNVLLQQKFKTEKKIAELEKRDLKITLTPEQKMAIQSIFPALLINGLVVENAPVWLQSQISTSVLQFLLDRQSLGALNMGAQELGYPLRDLLFSDEVNYMFAQFVSAKFAKPKSNVYASGVHGGGEVHYRISSGAIINQQQTTWLLGCRRWFKENVYYGTRPETIKLSYETPEEYRDEAHRQAAIFKKKAEAVYVDFENRKKALINALILHQNNSRNPRFYDDAIEAYRKITTQTLITETNPYIIPALPGNDLQDLARDLLDFKEEHEQLQELFVQTQGEVRYLLNFADILDTRMLRVRKKN